MSIYIHGIDMPKERESFTVTIKYNGTVLDTETGIQVAEAYELPPHGRCIDADVLVKDNGIKEIPEFYEVILTAPTILEAEEDE